ncbi:MAG: hypothetical protein L0Y35_00525 [Flammeovirgaceae bacterium]|nr:hypothetical protein [Flammeovirgaceae bacterium]
MSKMTKEEKLFKKEEGILTDYASRVHTNNNDNHSRQSLTELTKHYKTLLEQTRFLTWISGRLERKLQRLNRDLSDKNKSLEITIDELTKARAGKMAYAIIYFATIILFVLEEFLVEPVINMYGDGIGFSILIKLVIVLFLKFAEGFVEQRIIGKKAKKVVS